MIQKQKNLIKLFYCLPKYFPSKTVKTAFWHFFKLGPFFQRERRKEAFFSQLQSPKKEKLLLRKFFFSQVPQKSFILKMFGKPWKALQQRLALLKFTEDNCFSSRSLDST